MTSHVEADAPASDPTGGLPAQKPIEPTGNYRSGACNIGPDEIARRRQTGVVGLAGTIGLAGILLAIGAPGWSRLALAAPIYVAAIGFIQARERFCVGFAAAGLTNFEGLGLKHRIDDPAARAADRRRAGWLVARAGVIALAGAVVFAALPV
jgi:hypothetical protein